MNYYSYKDLRIKNQLSDKRKKEMLIRVTVVILIVILLMLFVGDCVEIELLN